MTRCQTLTATLFALTALLTTQYAADAMACKTGDAHAPTATQEDKPKHNVPPEGFVALFNGKDIDDWQVKGGKATFQVEDGIITGTTAKDTPNTFLCTPHSYRDFELTFDVFLHDDPLNSGVQIRSHVLTEGKNKGLVAGPQVEIMRTPGRSGLIWGERVERRWMSPNANQRTHEQVKKKQWNTYRIITQGRNVKTFINGELIEDVDLPQSYDKKYSDGFIGLQVHSVKGDPNWRVSWRNIYLKERQQD